MKILIAVDDSPHSERALRFVTRMRWPAGSRMLVASVTPVAVPAESSDSDPDGDHVQRRCQCQHVVVRAQNQLRDAGLSTERLEAEGDARDRLLELVDHERVDLLVMGSRGRSGLVRLMMGSVSSHAVTHASCSVLVVKERPGTDEWTGATKSLHMNILIGVDDSAHSRAAVEFVRKMAWPKGSKAIVLSVVQPSALAYSGVYAPTTLPMESLEGITRIQQDIASNAEDALRGGTLTTEARVLHGDPRTTLIETARNEHVDVIVVGSHGRTGLAKLLIGSVASHVVTHAQCSVLVVKLERR